MSSPAIVRLGTIKEVARFQEYLRSLGLGIPCDSEIQRGALDAIEADLVAREKEERIEFPLE